MQLTTHINPKDFPGFLLITSIASLAKSLSGCSSCIADEDMPLVLKGIVADAASPAQMAEAMAECQKIMPCRCTRDICEYCDRTEGETDDEEPDDQIQDP